MKKLQLFFTKIIDYPLLKNANFAFFLHPGLYCLESLLFLRERHQILFLAVFCIKRNINKISNFWPKPWTNPFGKNANFVGFWNWCFRCSERLVCYIKRRKSFLHDLLSRSMTWEYMGLHGVSRGYRGLQGVTRGYRGLQWVTRGDRWWKRVTWGYKGL